MKGYRGTQLRVVQTNERTYSRTKDSGNQHPSSSSTEQQTKETQETGSIEQRMKRHMPSTRRLDQQQRMARVEALRELVRTGRYHVDSMNLARSMLDNETHFTELPQP